MDELDLDAGGTVTKQEFVDAYILKHQQLLDEQTEIQEEMEDLELKFKMVNENKFRTESGFYQSRARLQNIYKVVVVEARNLEIADVLTGTSDPYAVLNYAGQVTKTTTKKTNLNPLWREAFEFDKVSKNDRMEVTVYDHDAYARDDIIGQIDIDMSKYPPDGKSYDQWFHLMDDDNKQLGSKIRLIIQHITHGMHDFEKEQKLIDKQMRAKEIELQAVNEMIELTEKPFAVFEIEKREKRMDEDITKTLAVNKGERRISDRLSQLTENTPWIPIMLGAVAIYLFFTLLACFFRPAFWDICNICFAFFLLVIPLLSTQSLYRYLTLSIFLSIIFDIFFLIIQTSDWWADQGWDSAIEQGLRRFSIVITVILIFVKLLIFVMFWHTSVQYYTIIDPIKQSEIMIRRYYRPRYDPYYNDPYARNYGGQRGYDRGYGRGYDRGGRGRYNNFVPHEETKYADMDLYEGKYDSRGRTEDTQPEGTARIKGG